MTQEERAMLADLANKIAQTPSPARDPDAEDFIRKSIGSRPDALYLMTQTVLIQNMALQQSQRQIQELQQRQGQPQRTIPMGGGSFLGQAGARPSYAGSQVPPPQYQNQAPQNQPTQNQAPPQYAQSAAPAASGMSGFLRGAAQTAAGVAAGTLAVQGIESLFSHHGGFGGGSGLFGGGGGYGSGETVIENNYYGDAQGTDQDRFADANDLGPADSVDNSDDNSPLQDADYDDNSALSDDSSYDTSGNDDNFA